MVHKGLPDSFMFLHFDNTSEAAENSTRLTTGVRYSTSSLLEWDGWTAPAKTFINSVGEHLDIRWFVEGCLEKVLEFHKWMDASLYEYHADDLHKLGRMQAEYACAAEGQASNLHSEAPIERVTGERGEIDADGVASIDSLVSKVDEVGREILSQIRRIDVAPRAPDAFTSERPIGAEIRQGDIIGTPIVWCNDSEGRRVIAFMTRGSDLLGLDAENYERVDQLCSKILELTWAKNKLSKEFIEKAIIEWFRGSFGAEACPGLSQAVAATCREHVAPLEVWAPIANLEVESAFEFGPATIEPISAAFLSKLEADAIARSQGDKARVSTLFAKLRKRMQGFAAVVVRLEAEPLRAQNDGLAIAQSVVGLLRFFSPVAREPWQVCSTALLGAEVVLKKQVMVIGEGAFSFTDGVIFSPYWWRLSDAKLTELRSTYLKAASKLVLLDGLNEFAQVVRAGLLLYSVSTTLHSQEDRLIYALSAAEGLLIKHSMELVEFNLEERLALLLAVDKPNQDIVARNVREIYRLRKRHGATLGSHDEEAMMLFACNTHVALCVALENLDRFETKADFIEAINRRKSKSPK
jgi:hypothetical protein